MATLCIIRSLFSILLLTHLVSVFGLGRHSLIQDKAALLAFKASILIDPNSTLSNWEDSVHVCNFTGVTCDRRGHRIAQINLPSVGLTGKISPFVSNLSRLGILNLQDNHLFGPIPSELSSLHRLRSLILNKNSLKGEVPPSLFSNCSQLGVVDLSFNFFKGRIPVEIGNCPNLWSLNLYNNQFTGQLPSSLINTSMYNLDVEYNLLSGELPSDIVGKLPYLLFLHLSYNKMTSHDSNTNLYPFFATLRNCSNLMELELAGLGLGGRLPSSIGLIPSLRRLELQENRIFGSIPPEIGKLSNLTLLNLTSNLLNGTIPEEVSQLSKLEQLSLSHNFLHVTIPEAIGKLTHLGLLDLSNNQFFGEILESLGDLPLLFLFLNNNLLSGTIPPRLLKYTTLNKLDLSYNRLTGRIPSELAELREIRVFINLSNNLLQGPLPIELSKLDKVEEINLSSNNLSGNIFPQISGCIAVKVIDFSRNALQGQLPDTLGDLRNLESFDVSNNTISGKIPMSLSKINLTFLNLSYNNFEGMIPSGGIFNVATHLSFLGNPRLCGAASSTRPVCPRKRHWFRSRMFLIIFTIVIVGSVVLSAVCCVVGIRRVKIMVSLRKAERARKPATPELMQNFPRITYRELSDATGGFDDHNLIGTGSYGRVYKGALQDGTSIAVKVLHLQTGNSTKSFNRECQVLKRIRHRNLIRIITACSLPDFKALVLPYMANGSLDSRLYPHSESGLGSGSSDLSLLQRVNICSDIAEGLAYLHHHSPVRVIHCDLKPSNVLLNDDMTALVSDFGIARLVMTIGAGSGGGAIENMGNSTANMLTGSIGYIAPEYGFGSNTSIRGDVYSFGVLVLEMVTRKRPTDDMFFGGLSLHRWVKSHYHGRMEKVVDSSLIRASRDQSPEVTRMWEVAIAELLELGLLCTQETPSIRPTMLDAADDLDRLKRYLTGDTTATFASSLGISSSTVGDD